MFGRSPGARDYELVIWFFSSVGVVGSFVGMIVCAVALVSGSGRAAGFVGLLTYATMRAAWLLAHI